MAGIALPVPGWRHASTPRSFGSISTLLQFLFVVSPFAMPISGNASPQIKEFFSELSNVFGSRRVNDKPAFGNDIATRLSVTHASIDKKADEPLKEEGKVVCELIVTEGALELFSTDFRSPTTTSDMLNGGGNVHGGCSVVSLDRRFSNSNVTSILQVHGLSRGHVRVFLV
jgi:hypothetical protein